MALGKRSGEQQGEFWTATPSLPGGPGHVFYDKLNSVLAKAGFDTRPVRWAANSVRQACKVC